MNAASALPTSLETTLPVDRTVRPSTGETPTCTLFAGGRLGSVNPSFVRTFGRQQSEWTGQDLDVIVHPDDRAEFGLFLARGAPEPGCESRCRTVHGWRWFRWTREPETIDRLPSAGFRLTARDVTRRVLAEEQTLVLNRALEQSPIGTAVADRDGLIHYVNPAYAEACGESLEGLLDRHARILQEEIPEAATHAAVLQQLRDGKPWRGEVTIRREPLGSRRHVLQAVPVRNTSGMVTHLLLLREDITERVLLEAQVRRSQRLESLGTLAGGIAHDFNNLLAIIIGFAELIQAKSAPADRVAAHAGEILKAAERGAELVRKILVFSRKKESTTSAVDLNQVVRDTLTLLRETFPSQIEIRAELAPDLPTFPGDEGQIQQVLLNLAVNARDAIEGQGHIEISTRLVSIRNRRLAADHPPQPHLCLKVSDDGGGIAPEHLARIFEPFFTTKPVGVGTGLGLAVVDGIVASHGGFVDVRSTPGQGTTFEIYFPEQGPITNQRSAGTTTLPRVLVVTPDEALPGLLRLAMQRAACDAVFAKDAAAAAGCLAADPSISIALVDETHLDVNEATRQLRKERSEIPIAVLGLDGTPPGRTGSPAANPSRAVRTERLVATLRGLLAITRHQR